MHPVIELKNKRVVMLDQRKLPLQEEFISHTTHEEVAVSIEDMVIRGAPAIGVAAAMGICLGVINEGATDKKKFELICKRISQTRPTAVNLFWAIKRMQKVFDQYHQQTDELREEIIKEALTIDREDVAINRQMGKNGATLLLTGQNVLTHCNAGALATAGFGTALGVIRAAVEDGKDISVISSETRPYLQGARLTVWEMQQENIPVTLITDNMAGYLMAQKKIDAVITGADRIAANGDVANKIGTFSLAVLARHHNLPFYVAAPLSTIDLNCPSGADIPIEQRDKEEVLNFLNQRISRPETDVYYPAFDMTPHEFITAIITEKGVVKDSYQTKIKELFSL